MVFSKWLALSGIREEGCYLKGEGEWTTRGSVLVVGLFVCFTMKDTWVCLYCEMFLHLIFQRCRSLNPEEKGLNRLLKFSGKKKNIGYRKLVKQARKEASSARRTLEGRMDMTFIRGQISRLDSKTIFKNCTSTVLHLI